MIAAVKSQEEPLDHMLFYSPKEFGTGRLVETVKQLSQFIARESGAHLRVTYASKLTQSGDLAAVLTHLRKGTFFLSMTS
jgi:Holliday junction resolvasome RuvABC ATP-dependent DNA helicase subunit